MADKYPDFKALSANEAAGVDFRILLRRATASFALVAPHGGGIEAGTSEIADAIAGEEFSFYTFEGLKTSGNAALHITSTHFDEPLCLTLLSQSAAVVTLHGEESEDGEGVFVGGKDRDLGTTLGTALTAKGFVVRQHPNPQLQGTEPENICNRGTSGMGVQFELSRSVRREMFESLSREGRKCPTAKFHAFVDVIREGLKDASNRTPSSDQRGSAAGN